jgi:putative transposase
LGEIHTHGRYATYWNVRHASTGHVWQGRVYSCPLDTAHLWAALRYTELNPVRAGLVAQPDTYVWSSAAAHCGTAPPDAILEMNFWRKNWTHSTWREYLFAQDSDADNAAIRQYTHTGRPLGTSEFIKTLEQIMRRNLAPKKEVVRKNQPMIAINAS